MGKAPGDVGNNAPRWLPYLVLGLMVGMGVAIVVMLYLRQVPIPAF